jgi:phosphodiesterase/alkaline phosphatase D-like protein
VDGLTGGSAFRHGPDYDQWDGYPVERLEILGWIGDLPVANTVVLSGDVHVGMAAAPDAASLRVRVA